MKKNGYYTILKIDTDASMEEIELAFQREQRQCMLEDKTPKDPHFKELLEAYEVLSDEDRRRSYDESQNQPVLNMKELEEKVLADHGETRFSRMIDHPIEPPSSYSELLIIILLFILAVLSRVD